MLGWVALGIGITGILAGLTVAALAMGARILAAGLALATLAAAPLVGIGPVLDWWRHRRPHRQRHARRPEGFGEG
ncbi:hypothetical protein [Paracraurococcus lichenis]|uniref:Uncharacterized protein n=1 Tax=Paracraurococcus lichenis TaxID=3064888 RepID=A0ABT9DX99_9PROT|nr:hypothetical protein [Paracraurococcus sp. LOR1-02]MDO9708527.1 hypothetical protein [Paracraurococcus sp. LOR1-02]